MIRANPTRQPLKAAGTLLICLAGLSSCSEPSDKPAPDLVRIVAVSPIQLVAVAGTEISVTVQARNSKGPVSYAPITFDFRGAWPTVTVAATDEGMAQTYWILPRVLGPHSIVARVASGDSVVFSAEAISPGPPHLSFYSVPQPVVAGQLAIGVAGIQMVDGFGDPLPNLRVRFEVQAGGGEVTGAEQVTDAEGRAAVGSWRFGPSEWRQTLLAIGPNGERDSITQGAFPVRFAAVSDTAQRTHILKPAPSSPAVRTWGALGEPMSGVPITFRPWGSGDYVFTDGTGTARADPWVADFEPGENFLTASITDFPTIIQFRLTGVIPGPARSVVLSGNGQTGLVGNYLGPRPEIQYFDSAGAPIFNLPVTWSTSGDGFVLKHSSKTDREGKVSTEGWRLGTTPGAQTVTASVAILAPETLTATALPVPDREYDVDVRILHEEGELTVEDSLAILRAAGRWKRAILNDLPDVPVTVSDSVCGAAVDQTVDDLLVIVLLERIDGPGEILGGAAPCVLRTESQMPAVGIVVLDRYDVLNRSDGLLYDVAAHEIGHVLGIGSLWEMKGLLGSGEFRDWYVGPFGRTAFHGLATNADNYYYSRPGAPIDNSGLQGTHHKHWAEENGEFQDELMTGFLNSRNVLSALTVASLRDLGYLTTDQQAEPFSFPAFAPGKRMRQSIRMLEMDLGRPMVTIDASGRIRPVIRRIPR